MIQIIRPRQEERTPWPTLTDLARSHLFELGRRPARARRRRRFSLRLEIDRDLKLAFLRRTKPLT
jgi:hypothetical protein